MKMFSFGIALLAAMAIASSAEAGRRHCRGGGGCGSYDACGGTYGGCGTYGGGCAVDGGYIAPAAASPAADDQAAPASAEMARNQATGYRSFSYQPAAAAPVYNNNINSGYSRGYNGRNNQPMWMNGANKSLGRYN